MLYSFSCLIPSGGTEYTQTKFSLQLASGIINNIDIYFPDGCCGLVHCHINDSLYQIVPTNADGSLTGSGNLIKFNEDISFTSEPYQLQFWGWNEDTTYDHTIDVRIELAKRSSLLRYTMSSFASLLLFNQEKT